MSKKVNKAAAVTRSGFVAVAGRPNAGKSTLINALVGHHIAIVSPIAQTTRRVVRAALTTDTSQIVFVDLPGSQKPVDRLTTRMQHAVTSSLVDVDAVLWVIDGRDEPKGGERIVADMVFASGKPVVVALNKIDGLAPVSIMQRIEQITQIIGEREYAALVPISALNGDGIERVTEELTPLLPEGAAWFSDDTPTDMRDDERISEYVREATLSYLKEELPHATIVEVDEMFDNDEGKLHIECTIWVETKSQAGIIVGKGGSMIVQIGTDARKRIQTEFGRKVYLHLRAKVRKNWRDDDTQLSRWGL
ncbi:MAG: GTPase Era [Thermoleophilia bacterium]|nr:GTPase Era [Thermoleophilia bacterium]